MTLLRCFGFKFIPKTSIATQAQPLFAHFGKPSLEFGIVCRMIPPIFPNSFHIVSPFSCIFPDFWPCFRHRLAILYNTLLRASEIQRRTQSRIRSWQLCSHVWKRRALPHRPLQMRPDSPKTADNATKSLLFWCPKTKTFSRILSVSFGFLRVSSPCRTPHRPVRQPRTRSN